MFDLSSIQSNFRKPNRESLQRELRRPCSTSGAGPRSRAGQNRKRKICRIVKQHHQNRSQAIDPRGEAMLSISGQPSTGDEKHHFLRGFCSNYRLRTMLFSFLNLFQKKSFFQYAFTNAQECSLLRLFLQSHWNRVFLLNSFVFFSHTEEQFLA